MGYPTFICGVNLLSYTSGEAVNYYELIDAIDDNLQKVGWKQRVRNLDTSGRLVHGIWEGTGDGTDKIYIQLRLDDTIHQMIYVDSCAGYDQLLEYWEQPGSIQQWLNKEDTKEVDQPAITVPYNEKFYYWLFIDNFRLILVTRVGIIYESAYVGFIKPIACERQYPYPMYVAGNSHSFGSAWPNNSESMIFPKNNSGMLRRADGTWRAFTVSNGADSAMNEGTIFPYNVNSKKLIPNYREIDSINQINFLLLPVILCTNKPTDVSGVLIGVYWLSGTRDLDAERVLVFNDEQYMVFDTKQERGANTYFAIKLE